MADSSSCVFGSKCPQAKLRERRVIESMDKYRKETIETYDLCDGTLLNKIIIIEGTSTNGEPWEHGKVVEKKVYDVGRKASGPRCSLPIDDNLWQHGKGEEKRFFDLGRKGTGVRCSLPLESIKKASREQGDIEEETKVLVVGKTGTRDSFTPVSKPRINSSSLQQAVFSGNYSQQSIEVLTKEMELDELPFLISTSRPSFPMCEYRPPRPSSQTTHFSERTLSIYGSISKKSSSAPENLPSEIPVPAPRRFSLKVDERSLNASPKEPIRPMSVQERAVDMGPIVRSSILSAPTDLLFHEEYQGEMGFRQSSPLLVSTDLLTRQSIGRTSVRTSSRSNESHILRSQSVRNRQIDVRGSPQPMALSPKPMGDQPRFKEIPVYRYVGYGKYPSYEWKRAPLLLQEETVTKETFEKVTTARRLLRGTAV